jgi:putative oxygen-independent coproporphyrinogen III oxidase
MLDTLVSNTARAAAKRQPFGVYVHWPFCARKCPYCDFNSHVRAQVDHDRWRAALLQALESEAAQGVEGEVVSLFFGGGTPSLMQPQSVEAIINALTRLWPVAANLEITLEANPSSVEAERFGDFARAGINRASLGIQALDDEALRFLGRLHSAQEALHALEIAQQHLKRVSFDLIYARPNQSLEAWGRELAQALALGSEHLSLYQLTIEPNTGFAGRYARGEFTLPDEEAAAQLFALTQSLTQRAGLPAYEISNHARPGAQSQHNLLYWRYNDYIGIGPGAHGRRMGVATTCFKRPEAWLAHVAKTGHGLESQTPLDPVVRAQEALLMGLRLAEGINAAHFAQRTGVALTDMLNPIKFAHMQQDGFIAWDGQQLKATAKGWPLLNTLLGAIIA